MSHANEDTQHYPLHMILGIVSPAAVNDVLADLETLGIPSEGRHVAQGAADAQRIADGRASSVFEYIAEKLQFSDDQDQRRVYLTALQHGDAVIGTRIAMDTQKAIVAKAFVQHGGHTIHYYGRWTVEVLQP